MNFHPFRVVARLRLQANRRRQHRDQLRLDAALLEALPLLEDVTARAPQIAKELKPSYDQYIGNVSSPVMAMSHQLGTFLLSLCDVLKPQTVLDLGSGFSSFVFRTYAARADNDVTVTSVDDSPQWLRRTQEFLEASGLPSDRLLSWESFNVKGHGTFDLVFHDLGSTKIRAETLPAVLDMAAQPGLVILDDIHKGAYERVARQVVGQRGWPVFPLRSHTLDQFGRYSGLVLVA